MKLGRISPAAAFLALAAIGLTADFAGPSPRAAAADAQTPVRPSSACTAATVSALAKTGVSIASATTVGAGGSAFCRVKGSIATLGEGAPPGTARFELNLPAQWNRKLLFLGGGGFDGEIPPAPAGEIARGYATLATDSGHVGGGGFPDPSLDAGWARTPAGARDEARLADYAYRARHQVDARVRPIIGRYYPGGGVRRAYFVGCSGGGREALIEAQRHPEDYDGFIAGDPWVNPRTALLAARNFRLLLDTPIPYARFAAIDRTVMDDCDKADGVADGQIQNPAACRFDPQALATAGVLTAAQARALAKVLTAVRDSDGRFITYAGSPAGLGEGSGAMPGVSGGITGLSAYLTDPPPSAGPPQPWGTATKGPVAWMLAYGVLAGLVFNDPELDIVGQGVLDLDGAVRPGAAAMVDQRLAPMVVDPAAMGPMFKKRRKLIIYQGYADTIVDPYSTIDVYRRIAAAGGGLAKARASARLFMVPDMQHCAGGTGPDAFDPLAAMEAWAERGVAPDAIIASKLESGDGGAAPVRSMPLCPWPQMARWDGRGDVKQAASWSCPAGDHRLLDKGPAGQKAGWGLDIVRPE
jgi:feruloyl esterase